mgnify:FL=1
MPKSVFSKIYLSGVIILIITFLTTGWLMINTLTSYVTKNEENSALSSAQEIADLVKYRSSENNELFNRIIQSYANRLDATVFVCNSKGMVLLSSGAVSGRLNEYLPAGYLLSEKQYKRVVNGETINENGSFDGYFSQSVATAAVPLVIDGQTVGGVFVCRALPDANKLIGNAKQYFFLSILALLLVSSFIMYLTAKKITKPIKRMKKAAKAFSAGCFDERIGITGSGEIAELAAEFDAMADSLENLENNRRMFVADVSHELRTPMTTISGFIEGMLDGTIPSESRDKYLKIVLDESKRLTRLVNDLLYAEKYRRNEITLTKEIFDINELVRLALISFEQRITDKNIHAEADFLHESEEVNADRDSIQRVITNLVDNAIKFTENGGTVRVSTSRSGDFTEVSVFNSGSFISLEDRKKIFDRFYKTDKSRGIDKNGVGLGLHIVKSILSEHGGTISVDSDGSGTTFTFKIKRT